MSKQVNRTFCDYFDDSCEAYLSPTLGVISFFLNLMCVVVFIKLIRNKKLKDDIFKYLLLKSILDAYLSIRNSLFHTFNCQSCEIEKIYALKLLHWILLVYLGFVLQLVSTFCQIGSSINRYRNLTKKFKFFDYIPIKFIFMSMFIYSSAFYIYKFFDLRIVEQIETNTTSVRYVLNLDEHYLKDSSIIIGYVHTLVRDGITIMVIFVFNLLTLIEIKKVMNKKRRLVKINTKQMSSKDRAERAEIRLTIMVVIICFMVLVGHGLLLLFYFKISSNKCFSRVSIILFYLPYEINLVFYICFNLNFRHVFIGYVSKFLSIFKVKLDTKHLNSESVSNNLHQSH